MIARLSGRASLLLSFSGPKFARFCERSEGLVFWRCVEKGRLCRKLSRGTQRENDSFWVAVDYGVVSGERGSLPNTYRSRLLEFVMFQ